MDQFFQKKRENLDGVFSKKRLEKYSHHGILYNLMNFFMIRQALLKVDSEKYKPILFIGDEINLVNIRNFMEKVVGALNDFKIIQPEKPIEKNADVIQIQKFRKTASDQTLSEERRAHACYHLAVLYEQLSDKALDLVDRLNALKVALEYCKKSQELFPQSKTSHLEATILSGIKLISSDEPRIDRSP